MFQLQLWNDILALSICCHWQYGYIVGHRIEEIPEVPLVVSDKVEEFKKTKEAVALLKRVKAWGDIQKVTYSFTASSSDMLHLLIIRLISYFESFYSAKLFACYIQIMSLGLNFIHLKYLSNGVLNFRCTIQNDSELAKVKWGTEEESRREAHLSYTTRTMAFVERSEIFQVN